MLSNAVGMNVGLSNQTNKNTNRNIAKYCDEFMKNERKCNRYCVNEGKNCDLRELQAKYISLTLEMALLSGRKYHFLNLKEGEQQHFTTEVS